MPKPAPYLKRTAKHLSAIIDSVPAAIVVIGRHGTVELVNTQAELLFGYSGGDLVGEPFEILMPERFRSGRPKLLESFFTDPTSSPMGAGRDLYGMRRDGTEFPIEIALNPITTKEGMFVVSAIVDITERKQHEARFRATVESAPTAMVMTDRMGNIVLVNAEATRLFGYERAELLGEKIEVLIPARLRPGHSRKRANYVAAPDSRRMGAGRDLFALRKDGSEFPVEIGLNPVETPEGMFVLSAIIDITERKRQTEELQRANQALERSNLDLRRFAYVASHDLQSPLRNVTGFVQLLQSEYGGRLDEQADDWIRRTVQSIERLQTSIRDLLAYSRVDSDAQSMAPVSFDDVFGAAVSLLDSFIRDCGARVTRDQLPRVMGERSQLVQLMQNLIGNSLKYRGADPPLVHVSAQLAGNEWVFSVRDNGIGISPKYHERIFEIFQRLHNDHQYPGSGIGLAVCRRVVHRHGGRIWVESEPDRGSVFSFTIPELNGSEYER